MCYIDPQSVKAAILTISIHDSTDHFMTQQSRITQISLRFNKAYWMTNNIFKANADNFENCDHCTKN